MMHIVCSHFSCLLFAFFFALVPALVGQPFWQNAKMRAIKAAADRRDVTALQSYFDKS